LVPGFNGQKLKWPSVGNLVGPFAEVEEQGEDGRPVLDDVGALQPLLDVHKRGHVFFAAVGDLGPKFINICYNFLNIFAENFGSNYC
jgi:transposase